LDSISSALELANLVEPSQTLEDEDDDEFEDENPGGPN
jgi:hypothetical protein